jgi:hypothetical protein
MVDNIDWFSATLREPDDRLLASPSQAQFALGAALR